MAGIAERFEAMTLERSTQLVAAKAMSDSWHTLAEKALFHKWNSWLVRLCMTSDVQPRLEPILIIHNYEFPKLLTGLYNYIYSIYYTLYIAAKRSRTQILTEPFGGIHNYVKSID